MRTFDEEGATALYDRPRVVAIGGGHGLAVTLRAALGYAGTITAVVSVADNGGSSGRLRATLGIPAPGDLRRCIGALAPEGSALAGALEHRFESGELSGHAFGNLLIAALTATSGDFVTGVGEAARCVGSRGVVLPATSGPVELLADGPGGAVVGQVAITQASAVRRVALEPSDAPSPPAVAAAILAADQVVLGPGSLFTSVLAAAVVPGVLGALRATRAQRVYVANLREQLPETAGFDVAAHLFALAAHDVPVDVVVADESALEVGDLDPAVELVVGRVARPGAGLHDSALLGRVLARISPSGSGAPARAGEACGRTKR